MVSLILNASENNNTISTWETSTPYAKKYDWLQLTSGEWLKGNLKEVYNDNIEFDSKEMDLLSIDWDKVSKLYTAKSMSVNIEELATFIGIVKIYDGKIFIGSDKKHVEFEKSQVVSIVNGSEEELDYWSSKVTININIKKGNTNQIDYGSIVSVKRRAPKTRFLLDYIGNFSEASSVSIANNNRLTSSFDVYKTRYFYWQPFYGEYYNDTFQNIKNRVTGGVGLGYTFFHNSKDELSVTAGPGIKHTEYISAAQGEENMVSSASLIFSTKYENQITSKNKVKFSYRFEILDEKSGRYTHHMMTTLENELTKKFDIDISVVWDRVEKPTQEAGGEIPKKNDIQLMFGLGFEY